MGKMASWNRSSLCIDSITSRNLFNNISKMFYIMIFQIRLSIETKQGCMFPLPRVVYAMADDGLIFRGLANINEKTKTPVIATLSMASLAALLAAIFDIKELVDFMSIGTLMAYTLVATSVMILRYRESSLNIWIVVSIS